MLLYHLTDDPDAILAEGFRDGAPQVGENGEVRRGVWLSDVTLDAKAGVLGSTVIAVDVPAEIAVSYELKLPEGSPYREFCIPADLVNRFRSQLVAARNVPPRLDDVVDALPMGSGAIGLLSGDEFTSAVSEFDRLLLSLTGPRVALLLCAQPDSATQSAELASRHYGSLGAQTALVDVMTREQAHAAALPEYDVLFLGGGDPARLVACLADTTLWHEALRRWERGGGLAGSSAGAMALCRACTVRGGSKDGPATWSSGLGPLERFAVAAHASSRPRAWLDQIATSAPVPVIALDDRTGIVLLPGRRTLAVGPGDAWVATYPLERRLHDSPGG